MSTRKFSRVAFRVDATVVAAGRSFQGKVENLSMSGMFMFTGERLRMGEPVQVTIVLNGASPAIEVSLRGSVSRIIENGIGFTFEKTSLESYTHLKNIIAYNSDDADKVLEDIQHAIDEKMAADK